MRIAIVTLPVNKNFGGILQAFALQKAIEKYGHEAYVVNPDYEEPKGIFEKLKAYTPRVLKKYILHKNIPIRKEAERKRWLEKTSSQTILFIKRHINLCNIHSLKDLNKLDFDAFIIGSDQIWRKEYNNNLFANSTLYDTFGDFVTNRNNRIFSYASSFGKDNINNYTKKDITKIRKLLKDFCGVSSREDSGTEILSSILDCKHAVTVLDPTLLITKDEYLELCREYNKVDIKGKIATYILDKNTTNDEIITTIKSRIKKMSVEINNQDHNKPQHPVEHWLYHIANADFIITDSFHATVFSIIFEKPFIVIANKNRGISRLDSLLNKTQLHSQLIYSRDDIEKVNMNPDFIYAKKVINNLREFSVEYISECLNKIKEK